MTPNELYEIMTSYSYLYSICQHNCDGMSSCKMFVEGNDRGCMKWYNYYLNLLKKQNENLKNL